MRRILIAIVTHAAALAVGFALGIYALPILTAPASPDAAVLQQEASGAQFRTTLTRDLAGSDFLHWGEGTISLSSSMIVHEGALAPGPDYKLYLTPSFVEDEAGFNAIKAQSVQLGDVKSFNGFLLNVPQDVDVSAYTSVVIWCESFGEFITAGQYR